MEIVCLVALQMQTVVIAPVVKGLVGQEFVRQISLPVVPMSILIFLPLLVHGLVRIVVGVNVSRQIKK